MYTTHLTSLSLSLSLLSLKCTLADIEYVPGQSTGVCICVSPGAEGSTLTQRPSGNHEFLSGRNSNETTQAILSVRHRSEGESHTLRHRPANIAIARAT